MGWVISKVVDKYGKQHVLEGVNVVRRVTVVVVGNK